jgi:hypothetical protein
MVPPTMVLIFGRTMGSFKRGFLVLPLLSIALFQRHSSLNGLLTGIRLVYYTVYYTIQFCTALFKKVRKNILDSFTGEAI